MLFVGFTYLLLQASKSFQSLLGCEVVDEGTLVVVVIFFSFCVVDFLKLLPFVGLFEESRRYADKVLMFVGFGKFAGFHQADEASFSKGKSSSLTIADLDGLTFGLLVNQRKEEVGLTVFLLGFDLAVVVFVRFATITGDFVVVNHKKDVDAVTPFIIFLVVFVVVVDGNVVVE